MRALLPFFVAGALFACAGEGAQAPSVVAVSDPKGSPLVVGSGSAEPRAPSIVPHDEDGPVPISADNPRIGPDDARATIVVFVDLQCSHCGQAHEVLSGLQKKAPRTRLVWKHYPLSKTHPDARAAAEAAQGVYALAGGQAFSTFASRALASPTNLNRASFEKWAKEAGLKQTSEFARGLDEKRWAPSVDRDLAAGAKLALVGVPTVYVNGELYKGDGSEEDIRRALEAAH